MPVAVALTLAEAAQVLDPPLTEQQLRLMVRALRWQPASTRHTGQPGRPAPCYDADQIFKLHAAMVPLLGHAADHGRPCGQQPGLRAVMGARQHARKQEHHG